MVKHLLARGDEALKANLELLLQQKPVQALINENVVFTNIERDQNILWSLLLFSGYLKAIERQPTNQGMKCLLLAPNHEVQILYEFIVEEWLSRPLGHTNYENFLKSLVRGEVEEFTFRLQDCLDDTLSLFDVTGHHPEKFYHGFVLGMMISLQATHDIQSNKESGYGRYDVMIIPKDRTQLGIVIEFKTVRDVNSDLTLAAQQALNQIIERRYADTLKSKGILKILQLGIAFCGKKVMVVAERI